MRRTFLLASLALALVSFGSSDALAKSCRDAKGKFMKCPPAAASVTPKKCRDAKGHFAKCGTPGAKPA